MCRGRFASEQVLTAAQDILLSANEQDSTECLPPNASLRYLSIVDTDLIPLRMILGRPLSVSTTTEAAEVWFSSILLKQDNEDAEARAWWETARVDSPLGILCSVDAAKATRESRASRTATELLFFASRKSPGLSARPITPPDSSPGLPDPPEHPFLDLCIHALPLCSALLSTVLTPRASPEAEDGRIEAEFLPTVSDREDVIQRPPVRKRKSVNDAFNAATERRTKVRRKGGEGVAAAAAPRAEPGLPALKHSRSGSASHISVHHRSLSRSSSIGSAKPTIVRESSTSAIAKPSALSRMQGVPDSPQVEITSMVEQKNKDLVSRMAMTGMRLYGLYQSKSRRSRAGSAVASPIGATFDAAEADKRRDEEFKLIYHQVYKGTLFTFRQHISSMVLQSHTLAVQETVDRLLAIFCTEPLSAGSDGDADGFTPGGRKLFTSSTSQDAEEINHYRHAVTFDSQGKANTPCVTQRKGAASSPG